jgi:hypothetical protein
MYETLAVGVADRTVTAQDLNIADPPGGAATQIAAGFRPNAPSVVIPGASGSGSVAVSGGGMMPLDNYAARDAALTTWSSSRVAATKRVNVSAPRSSGTMLAISGGPRKPALQAALVDLALSDTSSSRSLLDLDAIGMTQQDPQRMDSPRCLGDLGRVTTAARRP